MDDLLQSIDVRIYSGLSTILNVAFTLELQKIASLPIKLGGLGVMSAKALCLPAFLSSVKKSENLISDIIPKVIDNFQIFEEALKTFKVNYQMAVPEKQNVQKEWSNIVHKQRKIKVNNSKQTGIEIDCS